MRTAKRRRTHPRVSARPFEGSATGPSLHYALVPGSVPFVNKGRFWSGGRLVKRAPRLDEADVVVELTDYTRRLNPKGTPEQRWVGSFKVVAQVRVERPTRRPLPEHFTLAVTGPDEWGRRRAVAVLADLLAKALGRQKPRATPEPT